MGSQDGLVYVVNNHGDRKSPKDRVVGPLPNGRTLWLIDGGDPNHLRVLGWSSKQGPCFFSLLILNKHPMVGYQDNPYASKALYPITFGAITAQTNQDTILPKLSLNEFRYLGLILVTFLSATGYLVGGLGPWWFGFRKDPRQWKGLGFLGLPRYESQNHQFTISWFCWLRKVSIFWKNNTSH